MAQGTTKGVPIDKDPLLANDSDLLVPSQKAVKTYVDGGLSNKVNKSGDTMAGLLTLSGPPTNSLHAATKNYVDTLINGIDWKQSANAATVSALPAYNVTGSGQVLTGTANGAIPSATTDGITLTANQRLLVKNEASTLTPNNGIYIVTQVGDGTLPFILTRTSDANTSQLLAEATVSVAGGSTLSNTQWHCNPASTPIVIGTTYITFAQIGSGVYTAGSGLSLTGNVFSIPSNGVTNAMIQSSSNWNSAYTHSQIVVGNPHGTTKSDIGLGSVPNVDATNPANITQSASYRFVTDTEKTTWNSKQSAITTGTTGQYFRGDLSLATFPTALSAFSNDTNFITASALSPYLTSATAASTYQPLLGGSGIVKSTAGVISYLTDNSTNWDTAYSSRIQTFTTTGSSGAATWSAGTLNIPNYTLSGLGGQPALSGTGFVKISGTSISYDNSTYVVANSAITGATKTKITFDSKGLVTAGADATTADIADSLNKRYVTDAQLTVLGNTSGTNTGDQNIFSTITVSGQSNVVADSTSDTLTLVAGTGVSITTNATTDAITINSSVTDGDKGDITVSGGGTSWAIDSSAVTLTKMANLAANSIIGNNTGVSATPIALTQAQVTAMINQFSSTLQGVVPASGGGTSNFLRADGTWAAPAGGGGSYTFSTGLTNTAGTVTSNLSTGIAGGQSAIGGTASSNNLTLSSTSNATKGKIILGSTSAYDEANDRLGIGTTSPTNTFHISKNITASSGNALIGLVDGTLTASANSDILNGLNINLTFANGAFTNVNNYLQSWSNAGTLRSFIRWDGLQQWDMVNTSSVNVGRIQYGYPSGNAGMAIFDWDTTNSVYFNRYNIANEGTFFYQGFHNTNNLGGMALFNTTHNLVIGYTGTPTDSGFKLDVNGTIRSTGDITVPDAAYGVGWNGNNTVPTKNAVYDKIESLVISGGGVSESLAIAYAVAL